MKRTTNTWRRDAAPKMNDYHRGEDTPCSRHHCKAPCCDIYQVKLLDSDVERLVDAGYPSWMFLEYENNYIYLRKGEHGCVFSENHVCSVHPDRPVACRTYPWIMPDDEFGTDEFCPYHSEFPETDQMKKELTELTEKIESEREGRNICSNHGCDACCRNTEMPLTNGDVIRLSDLGYQDFYRDRRGEHILSNVDKRCFFLGEDGRCTIYSERPEGCRFYPFILGRGGVVMDEDCPHREEYQARFSQWIEDGLVELVNRLEQERVQRL